MGRVPHLRRNPWGKHSASHRRLHLSRNRAWGLRCTPLISSRGGEGAPTLFVALTEVAHAHLRRFTLAKSRSLIARKEVRVCLLQKEGHPTPAAPFMGVPARASGGSGSARNHSKGGQYAYHEGEGREGTPPPSKNRSEVFQEVGQSALRRGRGREGDSPSSHLSPRRPTRASGGSELAKS